MSITSSNNLAVNNSLTVNGNSIFGVDNTSTIICNSKPTFNSDVTISGNITQSSGTFSTGSGNVNLNGDVIISSNKKLTTGTGDTTINGLLKCNGTINNVGLLASSGSFELGPTTGTNFTYIDVKTTGGNSDFDSRIGATGGSSSNSGQGALSFNCASCAIEAPLIVNGITNNNTLTQTGTIACNAINCTSINNSGSLTASGTSSLGTLNVSGTTTLTGVLYTYNGITNSNAAIVNNSTLTQVGTSVFADVVRVSPGKSIYVSNNSFTDYIRMHHTGIGGNSIIDFTGDFSIKNGASSLTIPLTINGGTNQSTFSSNLNANGITNNGILYQNNTSTFSSAITAPSITSSGTFYAGSFNNFDTIAISAPKVINGIASGTGDGATYTQFNLAINSWQGVGFVYSNPGGPSVCKLVIDTRTGNLTTQGDITCNSVIASTLTAPKINLNYTTLPTFTSSMVGYQNTFYVPLTNITSGVNYSLNTFTLPLGVWNIEVKIIFYASSLNVTIPQYSVTLFSSSNIIYELINNSTLITFALTSTYNVSTIYQNPYDVSASLLYTQQSYTGSGLQILGNGSDKSFVKITRIA